MQIKTDTAKFPDYTIEIIDRSRESVIFTLDGETDYCLEITPEWETEQDYERNESYTVEWNGLNWPNIEEHCKQHFNESERLK